MIPFTVIETIKWEPGLYEIEEPIEIPENTHVDARGVTLVLWDGDGLKLARNASIEGVTVRLSRLHPDYVAPKLDLSKFVPV